MFREKPTGKDKALSSMNHISGDIIQEERILDNIMVPVYFEADAAGARNALQKILRVILDDPKLTVRTFHPEHVVSNVGHHGIRIDVFAEDGSGRLIALELQKDTSEPLLHRAVFEGATLGAHSLAAGEAYDKLPKIYVVYVMENDRFRRGAPVYETETLFTDGGQEMKDIAASYIFVNGAYRSIGTELGRVIHDIMERDAHKMLVPEIRDRALLLKNTEEGQRKMNAALEAYIERERAESKAEGKAEGRAEGVIRTARNIGMDDEAVLAQLMDQLAISPEQASAYLKQFGSV